MIPLVDLKAQYESIRAELEPVVLETLASTQYVLGEQVEAFEADFAGFTGCRYAVAVNSGTTALQLALTAAGVGDGDEVITVAATFVATAAAIIYTGATPVFVDVEESSYLIDLDQVEAAITPATKALIPVHLFGRPVDMERVSSIAQRHNLKVVEDCAQASGASWAGRPVGSWGDVGCFKIGRAHV